MPIVRYPDPRLSAKALPRDLDDELWAIGQKLLETLDATRAYGLAAAHIGEVAPIVAFITDPALQRRDSIVMFNPRVTAVSGDIVPGTEGSVSLPGIEVTIGRPQWADVSWQDADGVGHAQRFEDILGRIAQHEIDQVNGTFFLQRLSRLKREAALRKWKKLSG